LTGELDYSRFLSKDKPQKEQYEFYLAELARRLRREKCKYENEKESEKVIEILARLFPYFGMKIGKTMQAVDGLYRKAICC